MYHNSELLNFYGITKMSSKIYPVPFGINVSVEIVRNREKDIARVFVLAPIYMRKKWQFEHCYSCNFSDCEIIADSDFTSKMLGYFPSNV